MKNLLKTETNSNWEQRPLSFDQILYAADDVRYLLRLMTIQQQKINKLNLKDIFKKTMQEEVCYGRKKIQRCQVREVTKEK